MKGQVKEAGVLFGALKAGQQTLNDLDAVVMNDTTADLARYATEQYICKLGSTAVAAYGIDKAVSYIEELALPKYMRGFVPVAAATIGMAAAIHYSGEYMNIEAGANFTETAMQLMNNYRNSITDLINFDPNIPEGYLIGTLIVAKAGLRWLKNVGEAMANYSQKKKAKGE